MADTGLSNDELHERCKQLGIDCDVAINASESAKRDLEDIAKKTWQNIVTILKRDLKKDQTPEQAYDELIATGRLSKEVLQNIKAGAAGLDYVEKIESWLFNYVMLPASGINVLGIGIGVYVKLVAEPGLERARATTVVKLETLAAFERRMEDVARKSGPNVAARGVERQIMFTNNAMAAARQEALLEERVANARLWSGRLMKLGLWGAVAAFGVFIALEIYKDASEKEAAAEIKRSLHWMYTSRFYMTVQQKYLEFLVQHFGQIEVYTTLLADGKANEAASVLKMITSHAVELDPKTDEVNVESIKPFPWSEGAVAAELAKHDKEKKQKTADDPTKEQMVKIHEEQLTKIHENLEKIKKEEKVEEKAHAAAAAAAKPN